MRIQSAMPLGQPRPMQADQAFPTLLKPHVAAARRVGLLRAMADTLFIEADRIEGFRRACAASSNPDGEACWKRIAHAYRTEAEGFSKQADQLKGRRA